jgi:hypothetical protein
MTEAHPVHALVVDGANVVGSRPDGWWRDRPGAARRLWERLDASVLAYDEVVLVLEGAARSGVPAGTRGAVLTVHAARSGDDAVVEQTRHRRGAGSDVTVVTADRGLRARVEAEGGTVVGPAWLLAST